MGRVKVAMRRIENSTTRNNTFAKRRNGLTKKAYELSILCDIDIALIMFSPTNRLSLFSSKPRIEDVVSRYINLPDKEIENAVIFPDQSRRFVIRNKEYLLRTLQQLKTEDDIALQLTNPAAMNSKVEDLQREISRLQQQLQAAEEELSVYEPDTRKLTSMEKIEACEKHLLDTLIRVVQRREYLLRNHSSAVHVASTETEAEEQGMAGSYANDVVEYLLEDEPSQTHVLDPLLQVSCIQNDMGDCHVSVPDNEIFPVWAESYTSLAHFPPLQPGMVGPMEMMPREQGEAQVRTTAAQEDHGASNYETTLPTFN